jgi:hypothetical protein
MDEEPNQPMLGCERFWLPQFQSTVQLIVERLIAREIEDGFLGTRKQSTEMFDTPTYVSFPSLVSRDVSQ